MLEHLQQQGSVFCLRTKNVADQTEAVGQQKSTMLGIALIQPVSNARAGALVIEVTCFEIA